MLKLKVCGMKFPRNIEVLLALKPDFIGFIFYPKSKRYMAGSLSSAFIRRIPESIKKVGVFVNDSNESVEYEAKKNYLDFIQLHGNESADYCQHLNKKGIRIIKAFQIYPGFNFNQLEPYTGFCDYFLFDTQSSSYGGSGNKFEWQILNNYKNEKPFFLSGGIDVDDVDEIRNIKNSSLFAVDINSQFEFSPGLKDIEKVKKFKADLFNNDTELSASC